MSNNSLIAALNMQTQTTKKEIDKVVHKTRSEDVEADYKKSRETLHEAIDVTKNSLEEAITLASSTADPKAYEVVASLVRNLIQASRELPEIQKKYKEVETVKEDKSTDVKVYFNGTTEDLRKMLKKESGSV